MKVLVAAVADHAWVENGCLSLCRAFDSINADKFPYAMPRMSVALRLLINRLEVGEHKLSISLTDADGQKLMNSDIKIDFQLPQGLVPEASFSFALNGQNVTFQKPGDYIEGRSIPYIVGVGFERQPQYPDRFFLKVPQHLFDLFYISYLRNIEVGRYAGADLRRIAVRGLFAAYYYIECAYLLYSAG